MTATRTKAKRPKRVRGWRLASWRKTNVSTAHAWFSVDGVKRHVGPMESSDVFRIRVD
jgi:hypothetical protein